MGIGTHEHAVIRDLERFIRERCGDRARVEAWMIDPWDLPTVDVYPNARGAKGFSIVGEQWIVLTIGRNLRWELGYTEEDIAEAKRIITAVVHGRGSDFLSWPFSRWVKPY